MIFKIFINKLTNEQMYTQAINNNKPVTKQQATIIKNKLCNKL